MSKIFSQQGPFGKKFFYQKKHEIFLRSCSVAKNNKSKSFLPNAAYTAYTEFPEQEKETLYIYNIIIYFLFFFFFFSHILPLFCRDTEITGQLQRALHREVFRTHDLEFTGRAQASGQVYLKRVRYYYTSKWYHIQSF